MPPVQLRKASGRAGEELVYGPEEMSTINQRKLEEARRIVTKLVLSGAMAGDDTRTLAPLDVTSNGSQPVRLDPPEVCAFSFSECKLIDWLDV